MAKKTETIAFVCDSDERAWAIMISHSQHLTVSALMRKLIKEAFDAHQSKPKPGLSDDNLNDDDAAAYRTYGVKLDGDDDIGLDDIGLDAIGLDDDDFIDDGDDL